MHGWRVHGCTVTNGDIGSRPRPIVHQGHRPGEIRAMPHAALAAHGKSSEAALITAITFCICQMYLAACNFPSSTRFWPVTI